MKKGLLLGLLVCTMSFGQKQAYDFLDQIGLVKAVLPNAQIIGVMVGPKDYQSLIQHMGVAQTQYGINVIPIKLNDVRTKVPQYMKMAAIGVVKNHNIDALVFIEGQDNITKSGVGIKYTSGSLNKKKIPVFSSDEKANKLGCLGKFVLSDDQWTVHIDAVLAEKLGITIAYDDSQIIRN